MRTQLCLSACRGALVSLSKSRLLDEAKTSSEHGNGLDAENNNKSDKGANDTSNGAGNTILAAGGVGAGRVIGGGTVGSTLARGVATRLAPTLGISDSEFAHALLEVIPGESGFVLTEKRELLELVLGGGSVGEEEADVDVVSGGVLVGLVGDELKSHGGGVVADTVEVVADLVELGQAEEGHKGAVGAELDVELGGALGVVDDVLESRDDLAGENGAGDGADAVRGVVGQVPLVGGSEGKELGEVILGNNVGLVVDAADIDVIKD